MAELGPDVEIHIIVAESDGVLQMAEVLKGRTGLDAVHILSHSSDGSLNLGSGALTNSNLGLYKEALQQIGAALTASGDMLLYGCDVAESSTIILDNLADNTLTLANNVSLVLQTRNVTASGDTAAGGVTFTDTNDRIIASGTGSLTLDAGTSGGVAVNGNPNITAGGLTTQSGGTSVLASNNIALANTISSASGGIRIQSQFGTITNNSAISTTANTITLRGVQMELAAGTINATGGVVNLRAGTAGVGIDLGSVAPSGSNINLSATELGTITTNNLRLTAANGISITANISLTLAKVPTLTLEGLGNITQTNLLSVQNLVKCYSHRQTGKIPSHVSPILYPVHPGRCC